MSKNTKTIVALTGYPNPPINYELSELYTCISETNHRARNGSVPAEGTLHAPDGTIVPGGYICKKCASEHIRESKTKAQEMWYFRPFITRLEFYGQDELDKFYSRIRINND